MRQQKTIEDKGQVHTLEGFAASVLVLFALFYAIQTVGVTPTSSSTASQEVESQLEQISQDTLAQAKSSGRLKQAILNWSVRDAEWNESSKLGYYRGISPPGEFGYVLRSLFSDRGRAYNIYISYETASGDIKQKRFVYNGDPTDNAVAASQVLVIRRGDRLGEDGKRIGNLTASEEPPFPGINVGSGSPIRQHGVYNILRVKLVVWRI